MDEKQIIALYWARSENAIAETARKYGNYCYKIAFNILSNQQDSEECVNDTYLNVWNAIPPKRPNKFSAFLGKVTRNLALKRWEKYTAEKRGGGQVVLALDELSECIPDPNRMERMVDNRYLVELLNHFLGELPTETRRIFLLRYWQLAPVKEIAAACGISESKVKMTLMRTRGKLKSYLEQEGIEV